MTIKNFDLRRFVVLYHEMPGTNERKSHWDFMIQGDESLRTWALAEAPGDNGPIAAEALADHRLAYLDYEGPVMPDRGQVRRWEWGHYCLEHQEPRKIVLRLIGQKLIGRVE